MPLDPTQGPFAFRTETVYCRNLFCGQHISMPILPHYEVCPNQNGAGRQAFVPKNGITGKWPHAGQKSFFQCRLNPTPAIIRSNGL